MLVWYRHYIRIRISNTPTPTEDTSTSTLTSKACALVFHHNKQIVIVTSLSSNYNAEAHWN